MVSRVDAIRVLIADDHPVVRGGVRAALIDERGIEVVGEARDGLEVERLALTLSPDVIIMDLLMPYRDGLQAMLSIKRKDPGVGVLFLTVSEQEEDLVRAIELGADGFLLKKCDFEDIAAAVRDVAARQSTLSRQMTSRVVSESGADRQASLSQREQQVLELVGTGLTNAQIGERLDVGPGTVNTYIRRIMMKLRLKNRTETITYALHPTFPESIPGQGPDPQ